MKKSYVVHVIPSHGETRTKRGFATSINAMSSGEAEARLMFRQDPAIESVEIVVIKNREYVCGRMARRTA